MNHRKFSIVPVKCILLCFAFPLGFSPLGFSPLGFSPLGSTTNAVAQEPAEIQEPVEPQAATATAVETKSGPAGDSPLAGYKTFAELESELQNLAKSELVELSSLGKTAQGRDLWLLTLSKDDSSSRPAILILGNVHGPHLLGRELALRLAQSIVKTRGESPDDKADVLQQFKVYVIPSPTPDATEKNFEQPFREQAGNSIKTDDDRDFSIGEDGPADLNGDGWITMMRVADPFGTHRAHEKEPRLMVPIDAAKAETGTHRLYVESRDLDKDKQFGEDAADGVEFNLNFTFNYPYFAKGAGPHQVSEMETRAIADFMFDHPEIGAVLCFSPEDNLFHPWKGSSATDGARIKTKILTKDQAFTDRLAAKFKELSGKTQIPAPPSGAGSFSEWAYFHYGRWSFASRGWGIPKAEESKDQKSETDSKDSNAPKSDEASSESGSNQDSAPAAAPQGGQGAAGAAPAGRGGGRGGRGAGGGARPGGGGGGRPTSPASAGSATAAGNPADDLAALAWFDEQKIEGFVDWKPFEHPDFPGKKVEIGGFKPFYRLNPPAEMLDGLVQPHLELLAEIQEQWPKIEISELKAKQIGPGIFEIRCRIVNAGALPTMSSMGELNRQAYPIMVELVGAEGVAWLKGSRRVSVSRLEARGGSQEITWLLNLNRPTDREPEFKIRASSPTLPAVEQNVEWSTDEN